MRYASDPEGVRRGRAGDRLSIKTGITGWGSETCRPFCAGRSHKMGEVASVELITELEGGGHGNMISIKMFAARTQRGIFT